MTTCLGKSCSLDFRCGVPLFIVILVIYKYKKNEKIDV